MTDCETSSLVPASISVQTSDGTLTEVDSAVYRQWELAERSFASPHSLLFPPRVPLRLWRVELAGLQHLVHFTRLQKSHERETYVRDLSTDALHQLARAGADLEFGLAPQMVRRTVRLRLLTTVVVEDVPQYFRDFLFVFELAEEKECWRVVDHAVMCLSAFVPDHVPDLSDASMRNFRLQAQNDAIFPVPFPQHSQYRSSVLSPLFESVSVPSTAVIKVPVPDIASIVILARLMQNGKKNGLLNDVANVTLQHTLKLIDFLDLRFLHSVLWAQVSARCRRLPLQDVQGFIAPFWRFKYMSANCTNSVTAHLDLLGCAIFGLRKFYQKMFGPNNSLNH